MLELIVLYAGRLLVVASPFLAKWAPPRLSALLTPLPIENKEAVASGVLLVALFLVELRKEAHARKGRAAILDDYLDSVLSNVEGHLSTNLRVNVMVASRWPLVFVRTFQWRASRGFAPGAHRDARLWLTEYQGVAGLAFRAEAIQWYDLRTAPQFTPSIWPWRNPFFLTRGQYQKTEVVKAVLSIPLVKRSGSSTNPVYERVGVLNVDAISDEGADWLAANQREVSEQLLGAGALMAAVV